MEENKKEIYLCGDYSIERLKEIISKYDNKILEEEKPKLVGYVARERFSERGFKIPSIGTPIYEFRGLYQIDFVNEKTGQVKIVKYYPESVSKENIRLL